MRYIHQTLRGSISDAYATNVKSASEPRHPLPACLLAELGPANLGRQRREAIKDILKCQLDEFRRGKVLTQKSYGIPAIEIFKLSKEREADLGGRLIEKAYDTPLFSPKEFKKDFTDADAKKVYAGLFHKGRASAEKDAVQNFGVGLELAVKSHPTDFEPDASQALARLREHMTGRTDVPLNELKAAFCKAPFGLTESMVVLYACLLVKTGEFELVLNTATPITLSNEKPLPGNRLTTHALTLCEWNAKLDKAILGSRLIISVQKGWNEVLPYARVLDDSLKKLLGLACVTPTLHRPASR